jgi:hypothetical protein
MPRARREVAILHRETGTVPILFGTIVAQRESLLSDTAKRLNNTAQGREAHPGSTIRIRSLP